MKASGSGIREHFVSVELPDVPVELKAGIAERNRDEILLLGVMRRAIDPLVGEAASAVSAEEEDHSEHPEGHRISSDLLLLWWKVGWPS